MSSGAGRPLRVEPRLPEHLAGLLGPVVSAVDLDLEGVEVTPAGRRRLLRVVVDRDGGIDLDDIATASHAISAALDASDAMGAQPYVLEVSSPGVDRPLTAPRHWRRARGRLVRAVLAGGEVVLGRVADVGDGTAVLDVDGAPRELAYAAVSSARVQVEFGRVAEADLGEDEGGDDEGRDAEGGPDEGWDDAGWDDAGGDTGGTGTEGTGTGEEGV